MPLPATIGSYQNLRQFILEVLGELGWGYHPDTRFSDYIDAATGAPTYTVEQAFERDSLQEQAFDTFGDAVYDLALSITYEWAGIRYDADLQSLVHCDSGKIVCELPYPDELG